MKYLRIFDYQIQTKYWSKNRVMLFKSTKATWPFSATLLLLLLLLFV
jgi:hypothetical protein